MVVFKNISILFIVFFFPLFITACGEEPKVANVGEPAPDFSLNDLQGKTWTLSELKGQVVFVNFWATWCAPCREEMPSMEKLYTVLPKDKFKMLALINREAPSMGELFAKKLNLTMPILNDQGNEVGLKYGITGLPETFIVDKQGILREKFIGPAQWDSQEAVQMMTKYINE